MSMNEKWKSVGIKRVTLRVDEKDIDKFKALADKSRVRAYNRAKASRRRYDS
jgi:hypothetical protein